jgi:hydrogenase nickel incorporation protein HypA/HybF
MHELGIAAAVLDAVRAELRRLDAARPTKVGVRVGELAGVDPDALRFSFDSLVSGSDLDPLELEVESVPRRQRCAGCDHAFVVVDYDLFCPECGALATECVSGTELELAYLEVEQP